MKVDAIVTVTTSFNEDIVVDSAGIYKTLEPIVKVDSIRLKDDGLDGKMQKEAQAALKKKLKKLTIKMRM